MIMMMKKKKKNIQRFLMCSGIHKVFYRSLEATANWTCKLVVFQRKSRWRKRRKREEEDDDNDDEEEKHKKKTFKDSEYVQAPIRFLREAY